MKCECDECGGEGMIECPECEGDGYFNFSILDAPPEKGVKHFEALLNCHLAAVTARRQAAELIKLKPEHTESYRIQLKQTLERIEREADQIQEGEAA